MNAGDAGQLEPDVRLSLDNALGAASLQDAGLIERVKARVFGIVKNEAARTHRTVRSDAGKWQLLSPGVERKLLWESGDACSCLIRLAPGASVAGHSHGIDEECVVLEGSLRIGRDLLLHAGDFHVGLQGLEHEEATTETGAVVYLRGQKPMPELAAETRQRFM